MFPRDSFFTLLLVFVRTSSLPPFSVLESSKLGRSPLPSGDRATQLSTKQGPASQLASLKTRWPSYWSMPPLRVMTDPFFFVMILRCVLPACLRFSAQKIHSLSIASTVATAWVTRSKFGKIYQTSAKKIPQRFRQNIPTTKFFVTFLITHTTLLKCQF